MLRDWTNSDKMKEVSIHVERFFVRLIMVADDHGCFYADPSRLRAHLFPLLLNEIREADIARWITESEKAGLIVLYENDGRKYLQIVDFNQRLRQKKLKYPLPQSDSNPPSIVSNMRPEVEEEIEKEVEGKGREKLSLANSNLYRQPTIPEFQTVHEVFVRQGGTKEMAEKFYAKHGSVGWYLSSSPITNFANLVPSFISNWNKNNQGKEAVIIPGENTAQKLRDQQAQNILNG